MAKVTRDTVLQVIEEMKVGATVRGICRSHGWSWGEVWKIMHKDAELSSLYAQARQLQCAAMAEELLDLADEDIEQEADGKWSNALVQHRRLQIDTRKWVLSKVLPRLYADKVTQDTAATADVEI
jgi:hypothetical protein